MSAAQALPAAATAPDDILDDLATGVLLTDGAGVVTALNGAAAQLLGTPSPRGLTLAEVAARLAPWPEAAIALSPGEEPRETVFAAHGRDLLARTRPRRGGGWIIELSDVTGTARPASPLDPLTRLATREALTRGLEEATEEARRGGRPGALLCLDLDRFKLVNDTLGHPMGDALLRTVAERLRNALREEDLPARLGGDEFAVLLRAEDAAGAAGALAARLVDLLGRTYLIEGHVLNIGASVGVALFPGDGSSPSELLRHADLALYDAKAAGRGTHRFFEPAMNARMQARRALETDLRRALALKQFALHYQPQLDAATGRVSGFEALLRWHHPERGTVSPTEFIPLAEEIGLIGAIGAWALRTACKEAAGWPVPVGIAVNLSPVQFRDADLVRTVREALAASGLDPARLDLEITEGALVENPEEALAMLWEIRALGVRVAMDDFGTGYSSLTHLQKFPFDKVKIDRSFVAEMTTDRDAAAIVRAVAGLGASLGVRTTAEGVETCEQLAQLRADGCGEIQGYLISRPLPAGDARAFLETRETTSRGEPACLHPSIA